MSVVSNLAMLQMVRTRLLTFTPVSNPPLALLLGNTTGGAGADGKLYLNQAPDDTTGFYATLRLIDAPQVGLDGGFMVRGLLECHLYGRPRTQTAAVERMADVVQEAWTGYRYTEASGNCLFARDIETRQVIPYAEPADRELVCVRMLLPFMATPTYLTEAVT